MKSLNLFISTIITLMFASNTFSQDMREAISYSFDVDKINSAESVTWYGWDYSHLTIDDPEHLVVRNIKKIVVPYWYNELEERDKGASVIYKKFKKKRYTEDLVSIQNLVNHVQDEQFENINKEMLTIDSIILIVNNYNVSGTGIGVVGIADQMKKEDISVTGFVVIFDIETKKILFAIKAKGMAGDKGSFAKFYSKGIAEIMGLFYKIKIE